MGRRRAVAIHLAAACLLAVRDAPAQPREVRYGPVLQRQGDHFSVDGRGRFLLFVSYFDGVNRPFVALDTDLAWLARTGVAGIRVWPNAPPHPIMNAEGHLDVAAVERLLRLVDTAARYGMVVDVTFHREAVVCVEPACPFSVGAYGAAIAQIAGLLRSRRNVLFDLQNEWNDHRMGVSFPDLATLREQLRVVDPDLPVTASVTATYGEAHAVERAFDVLAYHPERDAYGSWASDTGPLVHRLREAMLTSTGMQATAETMPIYLQEPNRFPRGGDRLRGLDDTPAHYWTAAREAKAAGAAAWTFHTAACFDLSGDVPFHELLADAEYQVIEALGAELATVPTWGIRTPLVTPADSSPLPPDVLP